MSSIDRPLPTHLAVLLAVLSLVLVAATGTPAGEDSLPDGGGLAATNVAPPADALARLAADAGASAFVQAGEDAELRGTNFGGTGPFTYAWTTRAGTLEDPTSPTALVDTTDLASGRYTATLTVTDATGATASDDVLFEVAGEATATRLLEQQETTAAGVTGVTPPVVVPFTVPGGITRFDVSIAWSVPTNDFDLEVYDPSGQLAASSGSAPPATSESTGVAGPAAGEWEVHIVLYANTAPDTVTAIVDGFPAGQGDTRPVIDAGGPYELAPDAGQALDGTVVGGTAPVELGWDLDLDGTVDVTGADPSVDLAVGRHLVTLHATDANGLEAREMTSVLVGTRAQLREQTTPLTVIGVADSGINPYHQEFSAATYPDPEVLALTRNFTRHPSEYIDGYPQDAPSIPVTLGQGYFPEQDSHLWSVSEDSTGSFVGDHVKAGQLYWIPGTKIIGAVDAGGSTGATSGTDGHPLLDDNGHGTGSASVSTGNRYGYCPTCLVVMVEALDESVAAKYDWIDISTNSFGYIGGLPIGYAVGPSEVTRASAERGQTTLFAAGNGTGNAFATTPILTYGSDQTGPDWNLTVGALREDNQEAIISDGVPAHISALGDGDLPSACRTGDTGQCAFGGTSAATPYTAGVFGTVLTTIRETIGDPESGQRPGQVVAKGDPVPGSPYLADGELTRTELRAAVLKTAVSRNDNPNFTDSNPYPATYNGPEDVVFEGYGAAGPASARRAIEVLLGQRAMPARPEDSFFRDDCRLRDDQYGSYDRDGDGEPDGCDKAVSAADSHFTGTGEATNDDPRQADFDASRDAVVQDEVAAEGFTYFLHREPVFEPDIPEDSRPDECAENSNEQFMDRADTEGDVEPCFDSRITSTAANFRPKGIFAAKDVLTAPLPAGSMVTVNAFVQAGEPTPMVVLCGTLKATDRLIGGGQTNGACTSQPNGGPAGYTEHVIEFTTQRPAAAGEQLTFQFQLTGAESWAYGYEGDHTSRFTITPAAAPDEGLEFGVTVDRVSESADATTVSGRVAVPDLGEDPQTAGFHPTITRVQVSVGDPTFTEASFAEVDAATGTYVANVTAASSTSARATGDDVFARVLRDRTPSPVTTLTRGEPDSSSPPGGTGGSGDGDAGGLADPVLDLAGGTRVDTAVLVSQASFPDGADTVVIARADLYPDALAGGPLAHRLEAPILLTPSDELADVTAAEIERLGASEVVLLGGEIALADAVETAVEEIVGGESRRYAGADRFDTARLVAEDLGTDEVYVTEGADADPNRGWPDAVAVSGLASAQERPILLVRTDALPDATAEALADSESATVVGGTVAVSDAVLAAVDERAGAVDRVAGADRYATSLAIAERTLDAGLAASPTWFVTGRDWPDALVAGPAAARSGGTLLLVDGMDLDGSPGATSWMQDHRVEQVVFVGGDQVINQATRDRLADQRS